jgi:hypothetical protein
MGKAQIKNQKVREPQSRHSSRGAQTLKREVPVRKYNDLHNSTKGRWSLATVTSGARPWAWTDGNNGELNPWFDVNISRRLRYG